MAERARYGAEEKAAMVMEIIVEGKKISEVAEERHVHPNQLMRWKKECLELLPQIFRIQRPDITEKARERRMKALEDEIARKDAIIAEIAGENMELKKKSNGLASRK